MLEQQLKSLQEKWQFKEEEMIRLSHEITETQKTLLQQNVEIDRLRHYESKGLGHESIIEKELENSKRLIEILTNKINILESDKNRDSDGKCNHHSKNSSEKQFLEEIETLKMEKSELLKIINKFQAKNRDSNAENSNSSPDKNDDDKVFEFPDETPSIATEEALEKLQERFRRTMLEVADLTEEKLRLEHLVTQLQFETETIGEYITLYQYQRRLLKQKDYERDIQLKNLAADRERMNDKLLQLNKLIETLMQQHQENKVCPDEENNLKQHFEEKSNKEAENGGTGTAEKILEILSDIKITNAKSYDSTNCNISVEHCSCCLGKLETV